MTMLRECFVPYIPCILLVVLSGASNFAAELDRDAIGGVVEPVMRSKRIPGAVVGVLARNQLVVSEAFGYRDLESRAEMTTETLFQIGSVTKPFTATLLALLASEGILSLDDTLESHLGDEVELPRSLQRITLRQLASHTSGLPRDPVNRRDVPDSPGVMLPYSRNELLTGLLKTRPTTRPGTKWAYSNLGYAVLGRVLEVASGETYEKLLRRRILIPLKMNDSGIAMSPEQDRRLATCYWSEDDTPIARQRWQIGEVGSFAGMFSSLSDLAKFVLAQHEADSTSPFSADVLKTLHEPIAQIDNDGRRAMALGWFVDKFPGIGSLIGHGGEVDGHSACIAFLPEARVGIIVLANQGNDSAESLCMALARDVLPVVLKSP